MQTIDEIVEEARADVSLLSTIDIDSLLDKIETAHYLENKNIHDISKEIFDAIDELDLEKEVALEMCRRLTGYRYVDKICDLRNGRWLKYIKRKDKSLMNGGILVGVKLDERGVLLMFMNKQRFFKLRFDDHLIFHKLTTEENLVLMAGDFA